MIYVGNGKRDNAMYFGQALWRDTVTERVVIRFVQVGIITLFFYDDHKLRLIFVISDMESVYCVYVNITNERAYISF